MLDALNILLINSNESVYKCKTRFVVQLRYQRSRSYDNSVPVYFVGIYAALVLRIPLIQARNTMMETGSTSETSVNFYQTTRRNNPEDRSSYSVP
jgi:hypothetical protein